MGASRGRGPTILFLPGYRSDMEGGKASALDAWAEAKGRAMLRFDYAGCGLSDGDFEAQTLHAWRGDVLAMIDEVADAGPVVLVGSSMGGWLMLLAALARPERVAGLVGIAAASAAAGIIEAQHRPSLRLRPGVERGRLAAVHVRPIAGQEDQGRALAGAVAVGELNAGAAFEIVDAGHGAPLSSLGRT